MANTRGVFTLQDVRYAQEDEVWVSPDQAFASNITSTPNVGYNAGGIPAPESSAVSKTDYSTDTTSALPSANLVETTNKIDGITSLSAGYFGGGETTPIVSSVNKITYNTETSSKSPGSSLSLARIGVGAAGNSSKGYFAGGYAPATYRTTADKFTYATETSSEMPSAALTAGRAYIAGVGNPSNGYFGGGFSPGPTTYSRVDKLDYSSDTTAAIPGANLSVPRYALGGTGSDSAGYFSGGDVETTSRTDKLTYSNDTTTYTPSANLPGQIYSTGATGNVSAGYLSGGRLVPNTVTTTNKITFSTDTTATVPGAALPVERRYLGAVSPRQNDFPTTGYVASTQNLKSQLEAPNTGYLTGGEPGPGPYLSSTEKLNLSTETTSALPASSLPHATYGLAAFSSPGALYATGGNTPGGTQSRIAKLSYSTDTYAYTGNVVSAARISVTATDTSTAGYLAGGGTAPTYYSLLSKIAYATDTSVDLPAANLSIARGTFASGGNQSFGYFAGGEYPAPNTHTSRIDKVFYNSETSSIIPDNLTQSKFGLVATGGPEAVYFTQGYSPAISSVSTTNKVSYSTDTVQNLPSAYSSFAGNGGQGGSGNKSYGYWGGTSPAVTSVDRVDYSTDVTLRVPGMNMIQGRNRMGGAGARSNDKNDYRTATPTPTTLFPNAPNTGYWAGGESPRVSNVDKIEYASETVSRSPYGTPELRNGFDGTGDTEKAFYLGGFNPSGPGATSTVQKLVYATDVWSAAPNLNERRYFAAVTGDLDAGYNSGGAVPATSSRTEKITFSTEATSLVPGANLSAARYSMGNVSNQTSGYALGGAPGPYSRVDKMTFSSETFAYTPGANLSVAKGLVASTGNASVALLIGGQTASKVSDADKLTFSTDTTSAVPSANLPTATGNCSGSLTGNGLNGYFAGGNDGSGTTAMYKVSFSTETTQYTPGRLSFARWNLASSSALESNQVTGVAPVL
jgi:hypothetical protein